MIRKRFRLLSLLSVMLFSVAVSAQHKVEMIPFGIWINGLTVKLKSRELSVAPQECVRYRPHGNYPRE